MVTHSLAQAKEMCDEVIWLEKGVVKECGPADKVCDDYKKEMMSD